MVSVGGISCAPRDVESVSDPTLETTEASYPLVVIVKKKRSADLSKCLQQNVMANFGRI